MPFFVDPGRRPRDVPDSAPRGHRRDPFRVSSAPRRCAANDCLRACLGGSATIGIESANPANAYTAFTGLQYSFNQPALLAKAGGYIRSIVFHPPQLEITKDCFAPETDLHNPPAAGTAEVVLAGQQWICRIEVFNHGSGADSQRGRPGFVPGRLALGVQRQPGHGDAAAAGSAATARCRACRPSDSTLASFRPRDGWPGS